VPKVDCRKEGRAGVTTVACKSSRTDSALLRAHGLATDVVSLQFHVAEPQAFRVSLAVARPDVQGLAEIGSRA